MAYSLIPQHDPPHYCAGEAIETLINRADDALYRAKSAGRDRRLTTIWRAAA